MELGLADKVAVIAGASRGIGFATAVAFRREGARVLIVGRDPAALAEARDRLGAGPEVHAVAADMLVPTEIARTLAEAEARFGSVDAVVANVGNGAGRAGLGLTPADWTGLISCNLLGSVHLADLVLARLKTGASLTFIASIAGVEALAAPVPYGAAKAGLLMAMKMYAHAAGRSGIRVNAIAPGNILCSGGGWERRMTHQPAETRAFIEREVPLARFGKPEEIADAVVFLSSERASFITGSVLVVDGGQTRGLG